jgi:hypothetical protein
MNKFIFCTLAAALVIACTSTQVGLKENWIDERDVIALVGVSVNEWMVKAGRPTLVEINGDTSIYYYNYRPTMYAATVYNNTTFFKTWGTAKETKPGLENATEIWGNRKNIMQIKVVKDTAVFATITDGPDKKSFIRDLNGDFILDPSSGYNSNISDEQKINSDSEQFKNAYNILHNKDTATTVAPVIGTNMSPWEEYRYRQQRKASEEPEEESVATESSVEISEPVAAEPSVGASESVAVEPPVKASEPVAEPAKPENSP